MNDGAFTWTVRPSGCANIIQDPAGLDKSKFKAMWVYLSSVFSYSSCIHLAALRAAMDHRACLFVSSRGVSGDSSRPWW